MTPAPALDLTTSLRGDFRAFGARLHNHRFTVPSMEPFSPNPAPQFWGALLTPNPKPDFPGTGRDGTCRRVRCDRERWTALWR